MYKSVSEMVHDIEDADFARDFDALLAERQLVKQLTILRTLEGLSEEDLIEVDVERIENSKDADLTKADIANYLKALIAAKARKINLAKLPRKSDVKIKGRLDCRIFKSPLNFSDEVTVLGDNWDGTKFMAFASEEFIDNGKLIIEILSVNETHYLIKLPVKTSEHGSTVKVNKNLVRKIDG